MSRIEEPEEVRRWRDEHPHATRLGLELELAACRHLGGPVEAFRAYLDALTAAAAPTWTPPDRDTAMRAITVRVAQHVRAEGGLDAKRPLGDYTPRAVAEVAGIDLDDLDDDGKRQAMEWCAALWGGWPAWLIEEMARGGA